MQILINNVDEIVSAIYKKNNIDDLHDFQNTKQEHLMSKVSSYFNIKVHFTDDISESNNFGKSYRIFLDVNKTRKKQWQEFAFHTGSILLYRLYGERIDHSGLLLNTARIFAYEFCSPLFLLEEIGEEIEQVYYKESFLSILLIMHEFNIEYHFAIKRLAFLNYQKILEKGEDQNGKLPEI